MKKFRLTLLTLIFLGGNFYSHAQEPALRDKALKIYYDCTFCDQEYIKKELTFVNYVRDSKEAQLHILVTRQNNGAGGSKYTFFFMGQKEFKGQSDTLTFSSKSDATADEIRLNQLNILKLGLVRYVAKTPLAKELTITYNAGNDEELVKDSWNSWVYNIEANAWLNGEQSYKSTNIWTSIEATRITEKTKFEASIGYDYSENLFSINDSTTIVSTRNSKSFEHLLVKSINDHWSVGYETELNSSIYSNYDVQVLLYPAIEYNFFPYSESNRKQIRLLYGIGGNYMDYIDTTLYNQTAELLFGHRLSLAIEFKEKWGSISASIRGSNYFNDFSFNRLQVNTGIRIRLLKGLSIRLNGGASLVRDQINLTKGSASSEDILLRRKQLASQYYYWASFGFNYTFGSIYNNVVNPRFGN